MDGEIEPQVEGPLARVAPARAPRLDAMSRFMERRAREAPKLPGTFDHADHVAYR